MYLPKIITHLNKTNFEKNTGINNKRSTPCKVLTLKNINGKLLINIRLLMFLR